MNPYGNLFDLKRAQKFLEYAIFFTPQYGDSFIEALKLYMILEDRNKIKSLKKVKKIYIIRIHYNIFI